MMAETYQRAASYIRVRRAAARIDRAIRRGETQLSFGPSSLNLMMADTCNSQCIMCGHDYHNCGSGARITLDHVKTIYSHLDMRRMVDVIYGGGGEPFMNPELGAIAAYTHQFDPVLQHTVITNGLAAQPDTVERLIRNRVHILISLNAATAETFRAVSGTDSFARAVDNVRAMVRMRAELKQRINISISMILMRRNIAELAAFVRLARDLGVDGVKTLYVRIYPERQRRKYDGAARIAPDDSLFFAQDESDRAILAAEQEARRLGISFDHEPLFRCSSSHARDCGEPWKSLFIESNGNLHPCPASEVLFKRKTEEGLYQSGNIFRQHYTEFWNNGFWQALRRTNLRQGGEDLIPECLCCGNSINWLGSGAKPAHILDWTAAETSDRKF